MPKSLPYLTKMTAAFESTTAEIDRFFSENAQLSATNFTQLDAVLTAENYRRLVQEVMDNPDGLEKVAKNSYYHTLGFSKITLIDAGNEQGWCLRNHIWWPQPERKEDISPEECRHSHRWDLTSRVLAGNIENQSYRQRPMTTEELALFERFETTMSKLSPEQVKAVCERLDLFETLELSDDESILPRLNGGKEQITRRINMPELMQLLDLSEAEIHQIKKMMVKISNYRSPESQDEICEPADNFFLEPRGIRTITQGTHYFHPVDDVHRLVIDPSVVTSTMVIIGPEHQGKNPGRLVHSRAVQNQRMARPLHYYDPIDLRNELSELLTRIWD